MGTSSKQPSKGVILSDCTKEPYFFAQSELSLSFVVEINQEGRGLEGVALHSEVKCKLWFSNLLLSTISPYTYFLFCSSKMKQIVLVSA